MGVVAGPRPVAGPTFYFTNIALTGLWPMTVVALRVGTAALVMLAVMDLMGQAASLGGVGMNLGRLKKGARWEDNAERFRFVFADMLWSFITRGIRGRSQHNTAFHAVAVPFLK